MLDEILDELRATLEEIRALLKELDTRMGEAYEAFLVRLAHGLYRFGYRLKGEEYEPPEDWE
jgi:hypothetical protein